MIAGVPFLPPFSASATSTITSESAAASSSAPTTSTAESATPSTTSWSSTATSEATAAAPTASSTATWLADAPTRLLIVIGQEPRQRQQLGRVNEQFLFRLEPIRLHVFHQFDRHVEIPQMAEDFVHLSDLFFALHVDGSIEEGDVFDFHFGHQIFLAGVVVVT